MCIIAVFDCCFSSEIMGEDEYRDYMDGIVAQLQSYFPEASFMVFNFREGERKSQISEILLQYDVTVMNYPQRYVGCPVLPLDTVYQFLRACDSWLSLGGQQNILLMHCERGGWPVLAFMLAGLLLYKKQYIEELRTLELVYKQAARELLHLFSTLDPQPSQVRYLHYITLQGTEVEEPLLDLPYTLACLVLRVFPDFDGQGGCRPLVRVYGQDPLMPIDRTPKLLFSTFRTKEKVRHCRQVICFIPCTYIIVLNLRIIKFEL